MKIAPTALPAATICIAAGLFFATSSADVPMGTAVPGDASPLAQPRISEHEHNREVLLTEIPREETDAASSGRSALLPRAEVAALTDSPAPATLATAGRACNVRLQLTSGAQRPWDTSHWHAFTDHEVGFDASGRRIALVDPGSGYYAAAALRAAGANPWIMDRLTGWTHSLAGHCEDASHDTLNLTIPETVPVRVYPMTHDSETIADVHTDAYRVVDGGGYVKVIKRTSSPEETYLELAPGQYCVGLRAPGYASRFVTIDVGVTAVDEIVHLDKLELFTVKLNPLEQGEPAMFAAEQLMSIKATDADGNDVLHRVNGEAKELSADGNTPGSLAFHSIELALNRSPKVTLEVAGKTLTLTPSLEGEAIDIELL